MVLCNFDFHNRVKFNDKFNLTFKNRYGDIIPSNYTTKIVVCIFSYVGLCMFGAASTLAGVGLSLMLDHRNKAQKQSKVRNLAATTIQIWYRYHLVSKIIFKNV